MSLEVIPAIDVSDGKVVRLVRGELDQKTVYGDDPLEIARRWEAAGAGRLHVVDIDAAFAGRAVNQEVIAQLLRELDLPVQVAGGIRDLANARSWIAAGADRIVLGTAALTDEPFLAEAVAELGGGLVVAPDFKGREVRLRGWTQGAGFDVADAARRLAAAGVPRLLCTDVSVDGTLEGPNVALYEEIAREARVPVIASGGIGSTEHVRALAGVPGIEAVVVGKALYTGELRLEELLEAAA